MIVVATKMDAAQDPARGKSLQKIAKKRKLPFMKISSVTGEGIAELKKANVGCARSNEGRRIRAR